MQSLRAGRYKVAAGNENVEGHQQSPSQVERQIPGTEWSGLAVAQQQRFRSKQGPWRLCRQLLGFSVAIWYVQISLSACIGIRNVLVGTQHRSMDTVLYESKLMLSYMGATSVRHSPLVTQVLQNDSTPRDFAIYLLSKSKTSTVECGVATDIKAMYSNDFQRQFFSQIKQDTEYNLTFLQNYELVVPVIDCSFSGLVYDDRSSLRLFYIVRSLNDPEDLRLLTTMMQTADYELVDRSIVSGATLLATVALLQNLTAAEVQHHFILAIDYPFAELSFQVYDFVGTTSDSYWVLVSVPTSESLISRQVRSSCRQGAFMNNERDRSNTENTIWELSQDPLQVIAEFQYIGRPTLRNAWAWIHLVHLILAVSTVFNLALIIMISTNHMHKYGMLWFGDAFVALQSRLRVLLPMVLISWYVEGFWSLVELCIHDGNAITNTQRIFVYESILRADLMIVCISLADLMGRISRECIEPAFGLGVFYAVFEHRLSLLQWSPVLTDAVTTFTNADYNLALRTDPEVSLTTPMRLWSVHELESIPLRFVLSALTPIFGAFLVCMLIYILLCKVWRRVFHRARRGRSISRQSEIQQLTKFEEATGTELLGRFGFVSHYANTKVLLGKTFATADGIYSSGFVVANCNFLVQTSNLWEIWAMKITGARFVDIYAYELNGDEAQLRAKLVHPSTITVKDLMRLNIHKLV